MARIFLSAPDTSGREQELVAEAFDSNYIAPAGPMLERFEAKICAHTGFEHAVALSSGTAALHLALRIGGVGAGDEVWTTSMTFIGGASPITFVGAKPVFFDSDRASWTIDADVLADALDGAAKHGTLPKAIVTTDLYGQSCDLDRILDLASNFEIDVYSDSAEALGARYKNRHAGKGAKAAILSFNGNKIITTSGGGMLLSDDENIIKQALFLATQARQKELHYEHEVIGYNYRLSNISAAIGIGQLETIKTKIAKRRQIFDRYVEHLGDIPGLCFMPEPQWSKCTRWLTVLTIDRDKAGVGQREVIDACAAADIEVRPLWKPMHLQPVFSDCRFAGSGYCEKLFETGICLPSGSGMSDHEQDRVIEVVKAAIPDAE